MLPRARWVNGDVAVDIHHDGKVLVNGAHALNIDRAGRVFDLENEPIAVLQTDGLLWGTGEEPMGWVGAGEAMLPGGTGPWLSLTPSGEVVRHDRGNRPFGLWRGCESQSVIQACTLVTHLIGQKLVERSNGPRMSVGVGVGVGF